MREKEVSLNGSIPHHYPSQVLSVVVTQERNVSSVHLSFDHLLKGRELLLSAFASSALSFYASVHLLSPCTPIWRWYLVMLGGVFKSQSVAEFRVVSSELRRCSLLRLSGVGSSPPDACQSTSQNKIGREDS